jgi:hypothetical protein
VVSRAYDDYALKNQRHRVIITWSYQVDNGRTWTIEPADNSNAYKLSFRLPEALSRWVFGDSRSIRERALQIKGNLFSSITIYRYFDGRDQLFRLKYGQKGTLEHVDNWIDRQT